MDRSDTEGSAFLGAIAVAVEPFYHLLDTHGRLGRGRVALQVQPENQPYGFSFDRVDSEFFLDLLAAAFGFDDGVAQWRSGAVPEPLAGILGHGARNLPPIFLGGIFIEDADDLADHGA
ncbi:hypothetical protein NIM87_07600 [Devosia sp. XJ19-1]|uniref:Uncharacterized protein n=1 Tax=Devosia ureilytica TaxID=2952754 RepID=A0A9Q4ALZ2_9HYPH|nr:hypothetical protein [Devosia ureilytica]MCP8883358.1 hypothetical protein [Devosia ureilytica]MCP8886274.1 hypothetical protein [Devosia ureilytica]